MVISYTIMLVNGALLMLFLSTATTEILNESRSARPLPSNCVEAVCSAGSKAKSGIYQIRLPLEGWEHRPFYVYCLLDGNGGDPWLLVQRRQDKYLDFNRNWNDYKIGFGNLGTNFFIGLDKLHALTQVQLNELQIELRDFNDTVKYANYDSFAVGNESEKYELNVLGPYSGGHAGDALLRHHSGQKFSTYDQDNDHWTSNCAERYKGAWWYNSCQESSLNGQYLNGTHKVEWMSIIWNSDRGNNYSLKYSHMGIRPKDSAQMRSQRC
ncbi:ficolin-1-like [Zeugodacus cucurbitae]|uniref:ficolin-1-like n=1 Tax=Zeugodacus cucurbitae TaxID=28588 RepID=UPI0023D95CA9|nr:ficolin-1-like [Zeugodacus cucurbitae]